jgi:hypothetical protein
VHRPWVPEPEMWAQYDFGDGPRIGESATILFCLWLAWSRLRVVLPLPCKSQASVFATVEVALRRAGGVPAYLGQRAEGHRGARGGDPGTQRGCRRGSGGIAA